MAGVAVMVFAAAFAYLSLVVLTHVDQIFSPGRNLRLPGVSGKLPGVDDGNGDVPQKRINILVMGFDRRPSEGTAPTRTDTMFVVTIDPGTKTAGILGIPRDLWVDIPTKDGSSTYKERINTAYHYGEMYNKGDGPELAMTVVENTLGIKLDHWLTIDFEQFITIIDDLGGIDVDVQEPASDPYYSWTELPGDYDPQYFEAGVQHMDGKTALAYSRIRTYSSDLDRVQRQQRVIFATLDKVIGKNLLDNPMDLWRKYKSSISTDLNDVQMAGLAPLAHDIKPERISALSLGAAVRDATTEDGAAVLIGDKATIARIVAALFNEYDSTLLDENATLLIQNGAGVAGREDAASSYLVDLGFPRDRVTTQSSASDGDYYQYTRVLVYTGKTRTAQKLAELLGLPSTAVRTATTADAAFNPAHVDIVIVLGSDAQVGQP